MTETYYIEQYREAIRLHLWYSGSKHSYHQGKNNGTASRRYRDLAHKQLNEISKLRAAA